MKIYRNLGQLYKLFQLLLACHALFDTVLCWSEHLVCLWITLVGALILGYVAGSGADCELR